MFFNVQDFSKYVLRLVGCSNLDSAFPKAHCAKKSIWFRAKVCSHEQEEFQRNFGFSTNRTTTQTERLVCAPEEPYQAQTLPAGLRHTWVYDNEHRNELRPFYTVSPRYRRAVPLCTQVHRFSRLSQDCGPLERASKLKFSAAT